MANEIFRRRLLSKINDARRSYSDVSTIDHAGLRGRVREIVAGQLLSEVLPTNFRIGSGKIVDSSGSQSKETDIIVYSDTRLPNILYSERDGIFPVEACFLALEVKSRLTSQEVSDAVSKAKVIRTLKYQSGSYDENHQPIPSVMTPTISALFAFESDISGKTELERYSERDPEWNINPLIRAICVAGRGYWWFSLEKQCWYEHPPTENGEEVLEFLAIAANTMIYSIGRRGHPRLGKYLNSERTINILPRNRGSDV